MRGFSLIELLMVFGLLAVLSSLSAIGTFRSLTFATSKTEDQLIESSKRTARNRASVGVCSKLICTNLPSHGVYLTNTRLVIFEGSDLQSNQSENWEFTLSSTRKDLSGETIFTPFSEFETR